MNRSSHNPPTGPGLGAAVPHRACSIEDVAAAAGVSTATVSRVLNNPALVSAATAEKVRKAVGTLGYKPNLFAKGLTTRRSRVLGLLLPDIHGEFYSSLLRGADEEARRQGYQLLVTRETRPGEEPARRDVGMGIADGLAMMLTEPDAELLKLARQSGLPMVLMDAEDIGGGDCVLIDNVSGASEAARHLLDHTPANRLYFVGGPESNYDSKIRAEAFTRVLAQSGHAPAPGQVVFREYSEAWGYQWAQSMHQQRLLRGAGVLCANDDIALGVLQASADLGVECPAELRVVGFDDTRLASLLRPRLSSVRVPMGDVGAEAVKLLIRRLNEPQAPIQSTRLRTDLIVRDSSARA